MNVSIPEKKKGQQSRNRGGQVQGITRRQEREKRNEVHSREGRVKITKYRTSHLKQRIILYLML